MRTTIISSIVKAEGIIIRLALALVCHTREEEGKISSLERDNIGSDS